MHHIGVASRVLTAFAMVASGLFGLAASKALSAELPAVFTAEQQARSFDASNTDATLGKPTPARIRIPLRIVTYKTVVATDREGKRQPAFVPEAGVLRTIRSRIDKTNHFFVGAKGEWHVETVPMRFSKTDKRYSARLNISKQVGVSGTIEEHIGSIEVTGVLVQEEAGLYNFVTNGRQQFRDKMGNPILEFSVGMSATGPTNTSSLGAAPPIAAEAQKRL